VHLANLVIDAGVEKDALGRSGLAGIDVGHDAEVTVALDWVVRATILKPRKSLYQR
jgi:hypothetical protein